LFAADATGPSFVPATPGGLVFAPGSIQFSPIELSDSLLAGAGISYAYRADIELPAAAAGGGWILRLEVFDNADAVASRSTVRISAVPEPSVPLLLGIGVVLALAIRGGGKA
jgi:hypothetical protein